VIEVGLGHTARCHLYTDKPIVEVGTASTSASVP
jgi:hypothetical protein